MIQKREINRNSVHNKNAKYYTEYYTVLHSIAKSCAVLNIFIFYNRLKYKKILYLFIMICICIIS